MSGQTGLPEVFRQATASTSEKMPRKHPAPFSLRLTTKERAKLKIEAKGEPLSKYIRSRLFDANRPNRQHLAGALGLLGQSELAENLNQIASEARSGSLLLDEQTLSRIDEACSHITHMRTTLIKALGLTGKSAR